MALVDEEDVVDEHALIIDAVAVWGHRPGGDSSDVGMVATGSNERGRLGIIPIKYGDSHGDVGQMCPTAIGVVQDVSVASPYSASILPVPSRVDDTPDALAH